MAVDITDPQRAGDLTVKGVMRLGIAALMYSFRRFCFRLRGRFQQLLNVFADIDEGRFRIGFFIATRDPGNESREAL